MLLDVRRGEEIRPTTSSDETDFIPDPMINDAVQRFTNGLSVRCRRTFLCTLATDRASTVKIIFNPRKVRNLKTVMHDDRPNDF